MHKPKIVINKKIHKKFSSFISISLCSERVLAYNLEESEFK